MKYVGLFVIGLSLFVFLLTGCSSDTEGWTRYSDGHFDFEYKIIVNDSSMSDIGYGDSVWVHYTLMSNSTVISSSYERGQAGDIQLPDKMHRNAFEAPMVFASQGDSMVVRMSAASAGEALSSYKEYFEHGEQVVFTYKFERVKPRLELEAVKERTYAAQKGFVSVQAMKMEKKRILERAPEKKAFLLEQIQKYQDSKLKKLEKTEEGIEYLLHATQDTTSIYSGDTLFLYYALALQQPTTLIDNTFERGDRFEVVVGQNTMPLSRFFNALLPRLTLGTQVTCFVPASMAYGAKGSGQTIPPNANVALYLEIVAKK